MKCWVKLLIHSQTSTVQRLEFWNGYVISSLSRASLSMLGLKLNHVSKGVPWTYVSNKFKSIKKTYLAQHWKANAHVNDYECDATYGCRVGKITYKTMVLGNEINWNNHA